jgi:AcrR family transcriptional regulator
MNLPDRRSRDRRTRRTHKLLHEALFSLIHERDFESIAVKEILHRANVGRSTFYSHFRDKDELLASAMNDILRSFRPAKLPSSPAYNRIIWFSLPIFEHIGELRRAGRIMPSKQGRARLHERLREVLVRLLADEVRRSVDSRHELVSPRTADLIVWHVASTFVGVLNWWLDGEPSLTANEIEAVFRSLIVPTLSAALESRRSPG